MKKRVILFVIVSFFSCKKEITKSNLTLSNSKDTIEVKTNTENKKSLRIDTLKLDKINGIDTILVSTLRTEINKDSIITAFIRFDFYNKQHLIKSAPSSIVLSGDEGNWNAFEDIFTHKHRDNRFVELSYGYDACGYTQTNFLFFIQENIVQLITTYESMVDGIYGTSTSFEPNFKDNKLISFTSTIIQVDSDESKTYDDSNEDLVVCYSDSIVYNWYSDRWVAELKTDKGKTFRKEFKKFNELYKSD